ncbi:MAG: hypothetical protein ACKOEV_11930, partial [Cytophagales bacterium]
MKKSVCALLLSVLAVAATGQVSSTNGNFTATTPSNLSLQTQAGTVTSTRLTILSAGANAGFVGIGTTAPADLLHVNGNLRGTRLNLTGGVLNTPSAINLSFSTNNATRMTILGATSGSRLAGFVGLNTTTPDDWFHVNGNIRANQFNTVSGVLNTIGDTDLSFRTNNTARMTIGANGLVGIGTASPGAVLDVAGRGDGSATDFRVGGRIQSNSAYGGVWLSDTNDGLVGNNGENIG